jgi:hypothetical protein
LGGNIFGKIFRFGWSRDLLVAILDYFLKFFGRNLYISKRKRGMLLFSLDIIATYFVPE